MKLKLLGAEFGVFKDAGHKSGRSFVFIRDVLSCIIVQSVHLSTFGSLVYTVLGSQTFLGRFLTIKGQSLYYTKMPDGSKLRIYRRISFISRGSIHTNTYLYLIS